MADLAEASATRDLILGLPSARFGIIRYVERATFRDQTELATMLAQGDFVWAGLVYDGEDEAGPFSPIESFHVSELDRLVERLREVRESFDETR